MGIVIRISYSCDWENTYFVQTLGELEAKEKAYKMFRQVATCLLPETLKEAEKDDAFCIEIIAEVDQIIL